MESPRSQPDHALTAPARMQVLRELGELDHNAFPTFTRFTRLAASILHTPTALITLVEAQRQVFLSSLGLAEPWASRGETPLTHSFCQYVVANARPFVVSDARNNPLVASNLGITELGVIAYAGVPLSLPDGTVLGALCAIDVVPRVWLADDIETLTDLAAGVTSELAYRHSTALQAQAEANLAAVLMHSQEAIWSIDRQYRLCAFNPTFARNVQHVFHVVPHIGMHLDQIQTAENWNFWQAHYDRALAGELVTFDRSFVLNEVPYWREYTLSPISVNGQITGISIVSHDISVRKRAEAEQTYALAHAQAEHTHVAELLETVTDGFVTLDSAWRFTFVNSYAEILLQHPRAALLGQQIWDVFPNAIGTALHHACQRAMNERVVVSLEHAEPFFDRWCDVRVYPSPTGLTLSLHDISARKQIEVALAQQFQLHESLLQAQTSLGEAIVIAEGNQIVYVNDAYTTITGYTYAETCGRVAFLDLPVLDTMATAHDRRERSMRGEALTQHFETAITHKSGRRVELEVAIVDLHGQQRQIAIMRDTTARKQAEDALRQSQKHFSQAFLANPAAMAITTHAEGRYIDVNAAFLQAVGCTRDDVIGHTAQELGFWIMPAERAHVIALLQANGSVHNLETRFRTKAGATRIAIVAVEQIVIADEQCLLSLIEDVTERRQAEQALHDSEFRFRQLAQSSPDCIYLVDLLNIRLLYGNRETFLGYTLEQLTNPAQLFTWVHESDQAAVRAHWQHMLSGTSDAMQTVEYRFQTAQGIWEWLQHRSRVAAWNDEGRPTHLLVTISVVTPMKQAEQERQALERQLREAQKLESLGVLAGGIAHDFNNLLVVILGNTDFALLDLEPDHAARYSIEQVRQASQRAATLTNQMLAYAGKGRFIVEPLDLNTVVGELALLARSTTARHVELSYDLAENLPPIEGDVTQIKQALMNVITNSAEAIGSGAGRITLTTRLRTIGPDDRARLHLAANLKAGMYVALTVADTGTGIDEPTMTRLFDPFFTTKFTGRGLGLAIVLGIIRAHQGAIGVESVAERGTQVTMLFPTTTLHEHEAEAAPHEQRPIQAAPRSTVLVIDDEAAVRAVTKRMLEHLGYQVLVAPDGEAGSAVFAAESAQIAAVLLDLTMPKLSAEATVERLRAVRATVPIIVVSGYSEHDVRDRFAPGVIVGVIQKPFTAAVLAAALERVVAKPAA